MSAKARSALMALLVLERHYAAEAATLRAQTEQLRRLVTPARPPLRLIHGGKPKEDA